MRRLIDRSTVTWIGEIVLAVSFPAIVFGIAVLHGFGVSTTSVPAQNRAVVAGASTLQRSFVRLSESQRILIEEINNARVAAGLPIVLVSDDLQTAARNRLNEMVREQYYAHISADGRTYIDSLNSRYQVSCENLNMSFDSNAKHTVQDWLTSTSGHRECLLNPDVAQVGADTALFQQETNQFIATLILSSVR